MRVSRNPEDLSQALHARNSEFPLSSVRFLNLKYYAERFEADFTQDSFGVFLGEKLVCVAIRTTSQGELSFFDEPYRLEFSHSFLTSKMQSGELNQISRELWDSKNGFEKMRLEIPIAQETTNPLLEGILPYAVRHSHLVEVEVCFDPVKESNQVLRKSHKQSIRKGLEILSEPQSHFGEITESEFDEYRNLHLAAAGRQTRSDESWKEQFRGILERRGLLVTVRLGRELVGATFSWLSPSCGYYVSGAYDRTKFSSIPISHVTLQHSITMTEQLGCSKYIVGDGYYIGGDLKEKAIGLFKRGFSSTKSHFHVIDASK